MGELFSPDLGELYCSPGSITLLSNKGFKSGREHTKARAAGVSVSITTSTKCVSHVLHDANWVNWWESAESPVHLLVNKRQALCAIGNMRSSSLATVDEHLQRLNERLAA